MAANFLSSMQTAEAMGEHATSGVGACRQEGSSGDGRCTEGRALAAEQKEGCAALDVDRIADGSGEE